MSKNPIGVKKSAIKEFTQLCVRTMCTVKWFAFAQPISQKKVTPCLLINHHGIGK